MDPEELAAQYERARAHIAALDAVVVDAHEREQAGQKYLTARCPRCANRVNLSGPGRHLCRACNLWLELRAAPTPDS